MAEKRELPDGSERIVEERNEARQGVELHTMRYVVIISTLGAALLMGIGWLYYY